LKNIRNIGNQEKNILKIPNGREDQEANIFMRLVAELEEKVEVLEEQVEVLEEQVGALEERKERRKKGEVVFSFLAVESPIHF
jgi:hypothetical protein